MLWRPVGNWQRGRGGMRWLIKLVYQYTGVPVYQCTNILVNRYTGIRVYGYTVTQVHHIERGL